MDRYERLIEKRGEQLNKWMQDKGLKGVVSYGVDVDDDTWNIEIDFVEYLVNFRGSKITSIVRRKV